VCVCVLVCVCVFVCVCVRVRVCRFVLLSVATSRGRVDQVCVAYECEV
jgi:hypothetical protein